MTRHTAISLLAAAAAFSTASFATADDGSQHDAMSALLPTGAEIYLSHGMEMEDSPTLDTWDPSEGPYDPATAGDPPAQVSVPPMSGILAPALGVGYNFNVTFEEDESHTLSNDIDCSNFKVGENATVTISGDVVINASNTFKIEESGQVELEPDATLTVFVGSRFWIENDGVLNQNTWDPSRVIIVMRSSSPIFVAENDTHLIGSVISPLGTVKIENNAQIYGWYAGSELKMENSSQLHVPGAPARMVAAPHVEGLFD